MNTIKKTTTILLICAAIVGVQLLVSAVSAAPRLVIEEEEFNFGYVPQNSKISHVFWLRSEGDDSLKILKVVPG